MRKKDYKAIFNKSFKPWLKKKSGEIALFMRSEEQDWKPIVNSGLQQNKISALSVDETDLLSADSFIEMQNAPDSIKNVLEKNRFQWIYRIGKGDFLIGGAGEIDETRLSILELCAQVFELLVMNSELEEELQRTTRRMRQVIEETSALHEISRSLESLTSLDKLLQNIVEKSMYLLHAESGSLMLFTPEGEELEFKVALGPKSKSVKPFRIKLGQGISGWVAKYGQPILIRDAYKDPRFDPSFDKRSGYRTRTFLCVPLRYKERILGVVTILNRLDCHPFSEKDLELLLTFSTQAALAIENTRLLKEAIEQERLKADLKVAAEIQKLLIPQELPQIENLEISATYIPCKEMSGDFYDVIPLTDGKWAFVMADVSGKSIPGAMLMSNLQASIRTYFQFSSELVWIIENLNKLIIKQTTSDRFITFFCTLFDPETQSLLSVNAGHNPPLLLNIDGTFTLLNQGGIFLGILPWKYDQQNCSFKKDQLLVMYTDGLVEAMNEKEEEFGLDRLRGLVLKYREEPLKDLEARIIKAVRDHTGEKSLEDDFTLMMVRKVK
ncbi:MAG: SpoIIE family protein phosphatase [Calditrichaeota bacterium]|nr:SpoIIE family protein phosphatase [Calditrichota bacterium]